MPHPPPGERSINTKQFTPKDDLILIAIELYKQKYGVSPIAAGFAPGKVTLLGDHSEFVHGYTLPMAIPMYTVVAGGHSKEKCCEVTAACAEEETDDTTNFELPLVLSNDETTNKPYWARFPEGAVFYFPHKVPNFNAVITSSIPTKSRLGSSTALVVATFCFLEALTGQYVTNEKDKAMMCFMAETVYGKRSGGVIDALVPIIGSENHVALIDSYNLHCQHILLDDSKIELVLIDTRTKVRDYEEYNERRSHCVKAAQALHLPSLKNVPLSKIEDLHKAETITDLEFKRIKHCISDSVRAFTGAKALEKKQFDNFGLLMMQSHKCMRSEFQLTTPDIDKLVNISNETEGVLGSKLSGNGHGGCTVSLIFKNALPGLRQNIVKHYPDYKRLWIYHVSPAGGCGILDLNTYPRASTTSDQHKSMRSSHHSK